MGLFVVGLLSGGKDSCFSLLHALANGHTLAALANLTPRSPTGQDHDEEGGDELDSHMYQTVGHDAVESIAQAMHGLPLFRARLHRGGSVQTDMDYVPQSSDGAQRDEVEDLHDLLRRVQQAMPHVNAVCVGAILSDYQRNRVENVCGRLGLTVLAYLWQQPQRALLTSMFEHELAAVLVKVAAMGLRPQAHLGRTLDSLFPLLCALNDKYDVHVAGEGGEYETVTLDCPLFTHRLRLDRTQTVIVTTDPFAPVGYLRLLDIALEPKQTPSRVLPPHALVVEQQHTSTTLRLRDDADVPVRDLVWSLDDYMADVPAIQSALATVVSTAATTSLSPPSVPFRTTTSTIIRSTRAFTSIENITPPPPPQQCDADIASATHAVFDQLDALLSKKAGVLVHVTVWLSSMSSFAAMNDVYRRRVPSLNPPSRVTLAVASSSLIRLDALLAAAEAATTTHVQSISNWAPANIGPYSQAVSAHGLLLIAGQIPLLPGSMALLQPSHPAEAAALALRHVVMLLVRHRLVWSDHLCSAIAYVAPGVDTRPVKQLWRALWSSAPAQPQPPALIVGVDELPRGAPVEWACVAFDPATIPPSATDDEDEDDNQTASNRRVSVTRTRTSTTTTHTVQMGPYLFGVVVASDPLHAHLALQVAKDDRWDTVKQQAFVLKNTGIDLEGAVQVNSIATFDTDDADEPAVAAISFCAIMKKM